MQSQDMPMVRNSIASAVQVISSQQSVKTYNENDSRENRIQFLLATEESQTPKEISVSDLFKMDNISRFQIKSTIKTLGKLHIVEQS